jgi:D-3-phosphoglycerate dehydrogenase
MKFLIIDDLHPYLLEVFEQHNIAFSYKPDIEKNEILEIIAEYTGLIVRSKINIHQDFLEKATALQVIGRAGSGMDNIDVEAAKQRNITLINAPEGNRDAVAEHCMALLLGLLNKVPTANQQVKAKIWLREANRGVELKGKTVGIIGYGNTGKEFAKRLMSFDTQILAYDRKPFLGNSFAKTSTLEEIQAKADVISFHVSLNESSRKIFNQSFLERCQKPFWLLNTSRGEVVDLETVCWGLENGKILGAGLDVLDNEKLDTLSSAQERVFERLASFPQVILSPHIAGWTVESYYKISEVLAKKILHYLQIKSS